MITAKPWNRSQAPKKILAIRLQAMGDVVITLPYLQYLRASLPDNTIIDFLTREESAGIPESIELFDRVYSISGGRNFRMQLVHTLLLLPKLILQRYDAVIDLQNNMLSRTIVRKAIVPVAWTSFDRYSAIAAGERNRRCIEAIGLGNIEAESRFILKSPERGNALLLEHGWSEGSPIIVLNPAGAFENRNWPIEHYVSFAQFWMQQQPGVQFLIMGIDKIAAKAAALKDALGARLINLVNRTNPATAFAIMQRVQFVLSEDSGLMHMAWVSGVPTLALFGSTRSDWARPLGTHTDFLDSSDLVCGSCMSETCRHADGHKNHCMIRFTPETVFERAISLFNVVSHSRAGHSHTAP